jgi:hypothetical protein
MVGKGIERKAKLAIKVARNDFDSQYVFDSLFPVERKNKGTAFGFIAKELFVYAARNKGLDARDWKDISKKYELSQAEYYGILGKMRNAGLFRKSGYLYYASKDLAMHLRKMTTALNELLMDLSIN